eukprot:5382049-Pyramimonas_sp.AAC.1
MLERREMHGVSIVTTSYNIGGTFSARRRRVALTTWRSSAGRCRRSPSAGRCGGATSVSSSEVVAASVIMCPSLSNPGA